MVMSPPTTLSGSSRTAWKSGFAALGKHVAAGDKRSIYAAVDPTALNGGREKRLAAKVERA